MDNQKDGANTCICSKAGCMCGHHNGHSCLMKWLFRIAAILVVFCLGYMMGELHGMIRSYGHDGAMRGGMMMQQGGAWNGTMGTTVAPTAQ